MSLVEMRAGRGGEPVSGGAMDRVVTSKRADKRILIAAGAGAVLLLVLLFWMFAPSAGSQSVAKSRLSIETVQKGVFDDFLPLRGRVTPLLTVFIDAVEGGRVEAVMVEDGTNVVKGQPLVVLSNADLQLSTLARQTEVEQQLNNMRSQELALQQTRTQNRRDLNQAQIELMKAQRQYDLYKPLSEKGFVSSKQFKDSRDDLTYQKRRLSLLEQSIGQDEALQSSQLAQLRASASSLNSSLAIARGSLAQLNIRAPATGQLSGFTIQLGQSLERGERVGQIDSAGSSKLEADVDEFYLERVQPGQSGTADAGGQTYKVKVAKVYPQVRSGQFKVDLVFDGREPQHIQRGQTLQVKLTLGNSTPAILVPNGAFFNDTGGNWAFVVDSGGNSASRREIKVGRRNADFIEVLDGLKPGEKVITSSYSGLVDKDRLTFSTAE